MNPLAELKDIVLPEQIHNYPIAVGWWVLLAIIITLTIFTVLFLRKRSKENANKRKALNVLTKNELPLDKTIEIIKWSALAYFPRAQVANLYGQNLREFLAQTLPLKYQAEFNSLSKNTFDMLYQKQSEDDTNVSNKNMNQAAIFWVTHALPPKHKDVQPMLVEGEK